MREIAHKRVISAKSIVGFVVVLVLFSLAVGVLSENITLELGIIGSMFTFIYGFFTSSLFAFLENKYLKSKELMASLCAHTQTTYSLALLTKNKKFLEKTRHSLIELLDAFHHLKPSDYERTRRSAKDLYSHLEELKIKSVKDSSLYARLIVSIHGVNESREKLEIFGERYLSGETKLLFLLSEFMMIIALLGLSVTSPYLFVVNLILIALVIFIGRMMFDLDNIRYGQYNTGTSHLKDVLKSISV